MGEKISLDKFAGGAFSERANSAIQQVLENIKDPNTDHKIKRKVILELTFITGESREMTDVNVVAKTKLAPQRPISSIILIDRNINGDVLGSEFKKQIEGQQVMVVEPETGEVIEPNVQSDKSKPVNLLHRAAGKK